ncbi:hypothetical protein HZS_440, partial [Henneguya salminicola]
MCDYLGGRCFVAQTVPSGLTFEPLPNIREKLVTLIQCEESTIDIASNYTACLNEDANPHLPTILQYREIHDELILAARRGGRIRFVLTPLKESSPPPEIIELVNVNPTNVLVAYLYIDQLLTVEHGIQHTKTYIFDNSSFYLGSANCDWKAY